MCRSVTLSQSRQPLPFIGLPLIEPELHPSYTLRSAVLSTASSNRYAASEPCTRDILGESVARLLSSEAWKGGVQAQVIRVPGTPLSNKEWEQTFARLSASSSGVELVRVDFGSVLRLGQMTNWLVDTWFPQALIDADAATVLSGARPVRATKVKDGLVRIVWEDLQPDLTVKAAGEHEIRISEGPSPAISVVRLSSAALPGEAQLLDKLVEGVKSNAYKKQFCTPLG